VRHGSKPWSLAASNGKLQDLLLFIKNSTMSISSSDQAFKETEFAQKVLESFKVKSFDKYTSLSMNENDFKELVHDIELHDGREKKGELTEALEKFNKEADSKYKNDFDRILQKGESFGIDWADVKFSNFIFQKDFPSNYSKASVIGHVNFTFNENPFVLLGLEATEFSGGYKMNLLRTVERGDVEDYFDPDLIDEADI
jgi:hypothetical protein